MARFLGPRGSGRRRRTLFGAFASVLLITMVIAVPNALAVHDLDFQLDGDVATTPDGTIGGGTQEIDWADLFDANGDELGLPTGFTASGFKKDFNNDGTTFLTNDTTTFATGSKDTLPISPGWQCNFDNNVNSKIDVMNAYAATYTAQDGDEILYFALERNTNTGDANVAFWFLQDRVSCETAGGSEDFVGDHHDGDILIVSEFSNGGEVSTINAYRWNDPNPNDTNEGSLGTVSVAAGADCRDPDLPADHTICATANTDTITTPWLTANFKDGVGHSLRTAEFFEGGINLTEEDLGGKCFNTFIGDTRSSTSLTATLFDFAGGELGACTVSMTTQPSQTSIVLGSSTTVTDKAFVAGATTGGGTAPLPTGTVTFYLCSPSELTPPTTGTCEPDAGEQVGSAVTVTDGATLNDGIAEATSANANTAALVDEGVGKYCFRAFFEAAADDPNYAGQTAGTDNAAQECFNVTGTSALSTAQSWYPNDTATVTGDTNLNGTLTFQLYTGDNCGATSGTAVTGQSYSFTLTNETSPESRSTNNTTFAVTAATEGSYSWKVTYNDTTLTDPDPECEVSTIEITD